MDKILRVVGIWRAPILALFLLAIDIFLVQFAHAGYSVRFDGDEFDYDGCAKYNPTLKCMHGSISMEMYFPGFLPQGYTGEILSAGDSGTVSVDGGVYPIDTHAVHLWFQNDAISQACFVLGNDHNYPYSEVIGGWLAYSDSSCFFPGGFEFPSYASNEVYITVGSSTKLGFSYGGSWSISRDSQEVELGQGDIHCKVACEGDPINVGTGNLFQQEDDFTGASQTGLSLTRFYNSQDTAMTAFGANWRSTWLRSITQPNSTTAKAARADGRVEIFTQNASGDWVSDSDVTSRLSASSSGGTLTGWTLVTDDDSTERYNATGQLLSVTTRAGLVTVLGYDDANRLSTVTGPFGHRLTFGYDASNRIVNVTLPDGGQLGYSYDANNNLISVRYPDNARRQYVYNENSNRYTSLPNALTGIIDENGNRFATFYYDLLGRAFSSEHADGVGAVRITYAYDGSASVTDARGNPHSYTFTTQYGRLKPTGVTGTPVDNIGAQAYTYDTNGFIASKTDFNGNITTYSHDARGLELSRTEAAGTAQARTISTQWHLTFHLPTTITEPSGVSGISRITSFSYDGQGNLLTKTETAGSQSRTWRYSYTASGQLSTLTDPDGAVTRFAYDAQGGLASRTDALGHVTTYLDDADGRVVRETDPNGLVTQIAYTPRGQLASLTVGSQVTLYTYDAAGNLVGQTSPTGATTTYQYDAAHRLTAVIDALGNSRNLTRDADDNVQLETVYDADGSEVRAHFYNYDAVDRLIESINASGYYELYTRDANGNITAATDPLGHVTGFGYDALNRRTQITTADGGVTRIGYNADDSVASVTDPRGLVTRYGYDGLGNQTSEQSPDRGTTVRTFDAAGNVLTTRDARGQTTTNTYDALNRLTRQVYADGTSAVYSYDSGTNGIGHLTGLSDTSGTTAWSYDVQGHVISKTQTIGSQVLTTRQSYDAVTGQRLTTKLPSGKILSYSYDPISGLTSAIAMNGAALISNIQYDPFGPVSAWDQGTGQVALSHARYRDRDGQLTEIDAARAIASGGIAAVVNTFDAAGRIVQMEADDGASRTFAYDALGRLSEDTATGSTGLSEEQFTYDLNGNRLTLDGTAGSLDVNMSKTSNQLVGLSGDLPARDFNATYLYDARGKLASAVSGGQTTTYSYNALGERVKKSNAAGTILFVQDGAWLTGEYSASGALIEETVYLEGLPVAVLKPNANYFINPDQLGAPRLITNTAGQPVWLWDHAPFGDTAPNQNPSGLGSFTYNLRFPGQYADSETGLFHNNARDYDPTMGRYVQSDPIGIFGGINSYVYVRGNPANRIDEFGLDDSLFVPSGGFSNGYVESLAAISAVERMKSEAVDYMKSPPFSFSITAGGFSTFGPFGDGADFGFSVDTAGHICAISNSCGYFGENSYFGGGFGVSGQVSTGELCSGKSVSKGFYYYGGRGVFGEGQYAVSDDGGYSGGRGFFGYGQGWGGGAVVCQTLVECFN